MNTISSRGANKQPNIRYTDDGFPVRNVYFTFDHQLLAYEDVETYFKSIGEVARFRLCPKPTYAFGFVQYQRPEHAAEVLSRSHCIIDKVWVRVKAADSCHQPKVPYAPTYSTTQSTNDDDTQTASEDANKTPVRDLNDDCLLEIFGYLNVFDLMSVAEACPRFQSIAQKQFSIKHKTFDTDELVEAAKGVNVNATKIQVWRNFLKHFGAIIVDLYVSCDFIQRSSISITMKQTLDLITNHCSGTLKVLKLDSCSLKGRFVQKWRPLFAGLHKLYVIDCEFTSYFVQMLEGCHLLTKLSICAQSEYSDCKSLHFHLPQLKAISFKHFDGFSKRQMKKLLERNPQLEKVSIIDCDGIKADILPDIVRYVPLVKKISFEECLNLNPAPFTRNAIQLKQLRSLKKLKLDCSGNTTPSIFSEMASAKVPLEYLAVSNCKASRELFSSICELKTLNKVSLIRIEALMASHLHEVCEELPGLSRLIVDNHKDSINTADFIKLVRHAKKLEELDFWHSLSIQMDEDSFKTLIKIVKKRPDPLPLVISVPNTLTLLKDVSDELITANRDTLMFRANHIHCQCDGHESDYDDIDDDDDEFNWYDSDDYYDAVDDSDDESVPPADLRDFMMMNVLMNLFHHN